MFAYIFNRYAAWKAHAEIPGRFLPYEKRETRKCRKIADFLHFFTISLLQTDYTVSSATGARLILEAILYQGFYEDGGPWFYTTLEPWEDSVSDGSQVEISESDAAQIMESHPYASIAFEAIPAVWVWRVFRGKHYSFDIERGANAMHLPLFFR